MSDAWLHEMGTELAEQYRWLRDRRKRVRVGKQRWIIVRDGDALLAQNYKKLVDLGVVEIVKVDGIQALKLGTWEVVEHFLAKDRNDPHVSGSAMEELLRRYNKGGRQVIRAAFEAFRKYRDKGLIADSVLLGELNYYVDKPIDCVIAGLRRYVDVHPDKNEKYARGIIRGYVREGVPEQYRLVAQGGDSDAEDSARKDPRAQKMKERAEKRGERARAIDVKMQEIAEAEGLTIARMSPNRMRDLRDRAIVELDGGA